jgi:mRNA-degrading endonuclease YafQ of YafQ-DinJ toxin-antitoxin module
MAERKRLDFSISFRRAYQQLPAEIQAKVDKQIRLFKDNPRHPSLRIHPLRGTDGIWEGYVDIYYQFTLEIQEDRYLFRMVGTHEILKKEARR